MALPVFPNTIRASDINTELGRSSTALFRMGSAEERALAGVPSGTIRFSDFHGKSNAPTISILLPANVLSVGEDEGYARCLLYFDNDGRMYKVTDGDSGSNQTFYYTPWASPTSAGVGAGYELRIVKNSGGTLDYSNVTLGSWISLSTTRFIGYESSFGDGQVNGNFTASIRAVSPITVLATDTFILEASA